MGHNLEADEETGAPLAYTATSTGVDSIIIGSDGDNLYQMKLSISFSGPSGVELSLAIAINDTAQTKYTLFSDVASNGETTSSSLSGLLRLSSGDVVTVKLKNRRYA